jgi:hypothetical protein
MNNSPQFDHDFMKKMNILSILRDRDEAEALRLYPELEWYIYSCRDKEYEEAKKELLKETEMDLVSH